MKNITLAVDDEVLEGVRKIAANRGTTVNAIVREHLTRIATQEDKAAQARRELVELSKNSTFDPGPDWKWNREELYEGRIFPRHERADLRGDDKKPGTAAKSPRPRTR